MKKLSTTVLRFIDYVCFPLFCLWLLWVLLRASGLMINFTPSMPIGLYRREPLDTVHIGQLVDVCLPEKVAAIGLKRGYIGRNLWQCPDGAESVIKAVIATPTDTVTVTPDRMQVTDQQGRLTVYTAPSQTQDHQGRPMKRWISFGPQGRGIWLYGNQDTEHSWDSRYYGPVQLTNLRSAVRPIWTFRHRHAQARPLSRPSPAWPANVWPDPDNPTEPDAFQLTMAQAHQQVKQMERVMQQMEASRHPDMTLDQRLKAEHSCKYFT